MNIRKLGPDDATSFAAVRLEALQTDPESFGAVYEEEKKRSLEEWKERLLDSPTHEHGFFGAFAEGKLAGIIGFFRQKGAKVRHKAAIVSLYVTKPHRKTGMAAALMQTAVSFLRSTGEIDQVQLAVVSSNPAAVRLYEKMGFLPYGHEKRALKHKDRYFDEIHMYMMLENRSEGM